MREQGLAATVLALAGLNRLGIVGAGIQPLDPDVCLPAVGQGILAVETRDGRCGGFPDLCRYLTTAMRGLARPRSGRCCPAWEEACQVPMGALAEVGERSELRLRAIVSSCDGTRIIRIDAHGDARGRRGAGPCQSS